MEREYDLFEQLADGSPMWRGHASGLRDAQRKLTELSKKTNNECFAMHLTKEVVARANVGTSVGRKPVLFQIAYDHNAALARTDVLKLHGYEVVTVVGNDAAKLILDMRQDCDLFVVGHGAPDETRGDMVEWLKANYPRVRILAVNRLTIQRLHGADYNVTVSSPEALLAIISNALGNGRRDTAAAC